jgi:hypothetical protein
MLEQCWLAIGQTMFQDVATLAISWRSLDESVPTLFQDGHVVKPGLDWTCKTWTGLICKTWTGLICKTWTGLICKTWTGLICKTSDLHKTILVKNRNLLTMTTMTLRVATGGQIFKIWQPNIFFFSQYSTMEEQWVFLLNMGHLVPKWNVIILLNR